ncbi:PQQ-binding-like beta-propeller repeat protein [Streptomyces sp. NPDC101118]|uniref:outer membrane protein assembly factor BamB family protein n=1 Tax=Streptomyces sp. NPDC101118 TaxID=3366109 RepID=UPI00380DEE08
MAAVCVVTAGYFWAAGRVPGDTMDVAWQAPADGTAAGQGEGDALSDANGTWPAGGTLVRSRSALVTGLDAGTGAREWEYRPPGRSRICATAADVERSVLLVTRDDENRPASAGRQLCTTLAAVDIGTGREIWRTTLPAAPREKRISDYQRARVTAGGGLTLLSHRALRAVDSRTGEVRWTAAVPPGCLPAHALPAARRVGAVLACGGGPTKEPNGIPKDAGLHAVAFDPATGALLWSMPVGDREPAVWGETGALLVSADPLVVDRVGTFQFFGGDGRPHPPIDVNSSSVAVDEHRLYALDGRYVKKAGSRHSAVAFDLATGRQAWRTDLDSDVGVFHLQDGRLTAVGRRQDMLFVPAVRLYVLDAATGEEREVRRFPYGENPWGKAFEHEGRLIVDGTAYARS